MIEDNNVPKSIVRRGVARVPTRYFQPPKPVVPTIVLDTDAADTLPDYIAVLGRRKLTLFICVLAGLAVATVFTVREPRLYQARALLDFQTVNDNFLNTRDISPTGQVGEVSIDPYIQSQAEIIRNETLIAKVVDKLRLTQRPEFSYARDVAIGSSMANVQVRPMEQARLIRLTYDATDPKLAAEFTNTLAQEFIQQTVQTRKEEALRTMHWLDSQVAVLKKQLEQSEKALQDYARRSKLLYLGEKNSVSEDVLRALEVERSKAQADRITKESLVNMANASSPEALPDNAHNAQLQEYQIKLTELRRQRAELTALLTPNNYKVQRVDAQIAELEAAIRRESVTAPQRIRNEYQAAAGREALLSDAYSRQVQEVSDQSAKAIHYMTLMREVETTRTLHAQMVQRSEESSMAAGLAHSSVRLMLPATPPLYPYKPNTLLNSALGVFAGLFLGITLIGVREFRDHTFKTPGELFRLLNVPELGAIPSFHSDPGISRPWPNFLRRRQVVETVTHQHRRSLMAESFRTALISMFMNGVNTNATRVVLFTSAGTHEGKTTLVSNLGLALAEIGRRVLLVNGDLRQPRLHRIFNVSNEPGLTDLLGRDEIEPRTAPLAAFVRKTSIPNLSILPGGSPNPNVANLLHSDRLDVLMNRLRREYDVILIDTPPALQLADARLLARASDGVVLIVRAGSTSRSSAVALANKFTADETPLLGTILNDWDPNAGDRDQSKLYLDAYRHYYSSNNRKT